MDTTPAAETAHLYDDDYFSWTQQQAAHLRSGRLAHVDLENVAEEIESLGKSQLAALTSSYRLIAMHLMKVVAQPDKASLSWINTAGRERGNVELLLDDNPGLKPKRAERFAKAYAVARRDAAADTGLPLARFPADPPFDVDDAEARAFWPEAAKRLIAENARNE